MEDEKTVEIVPGGEHLIVIGNISVTTFDTENGWQHWEEDKNGKVVTPPCNVK